MEQNTINAELRTETGKNANNRLRTAGFIPAVIYSHGKAEAIKINSKDFYGLFKNNISESVIFKVNIPGSSEWTDQMAFVKDFQSDPVKGNVTHVDLFKVTKGEKISTTVPIELTGTPKGVKMGGIIEITDRQIYVECLPKDLPETIEVDISHLDVGDVIHASDIKLPDSVKLTSNPDNVIATVQTQRKAAAGSAMAEEGDEETAEGEEAAAPEEA